ncbi:FecR domain-containing protein [candidate division KSB1 bacterium]
MSFIPDDELLARYLSGECTGEEREKVKFWMDSDPENKKLLEGMRKTWSTAGGVSGHWDILKIWGNIVKAAGIGNGTEYKMKRKPIFSLQSFPAFAKIAAVLLIMLSIPYFVSRIVQNISVIQNEVVLNEAIVEKGKTTELTLSDNTVVTLDAGTTFSYPENFGPDKREVYLNGEGFFKVESNPQKPFIIHAKEAEVTVLGTEFNVRAWGNNENIEVAVAEGRVAFRSGSEDAAAEGVVISKGQMSIMKGENEPEEPRDIDISRYLLWMNREMDFGNTPLVEVLDQLERWYDIQFILPDDSYAQNRITIFIENKPVEDILDVICLIMEFNYERIDNEITFLINEPKK